MLNMLNMKNITYIFITIVFFLIGCGPSLQEQHDEIEKALKTLRNAATFVRQQVAMNLDLRYAPHVHFVRDTAEENAARVSEILGDLKAKGEIKKKDEG